MARHDSSEAVGRLHFIPEWADKRELTQADIVRAVGADKGTVSRWFAGQMPNDRWFGPLADLFALDDPVSLFRHPEDDWLSRFFADRTEEERQRMKALLEAAFPRRAA